MIILTDKDIARFKSKFVELSENECWLYQGSPSTHGYGQFWLTPLERNEGAHVVAYILAYGSVPTGKLVLHTCDIRLCVNYHHLYAGTHQDNAKDAVVRGRHRNQWPIVCDEEIASIATLYKQVGTVRGVAFMLALSRNKIKRSLRLAGVL